MRLLRSKAAHAVLAALLLGVFLMQLALSIRHQSQTYDEGFHLVAGYRYWQCGDFGINSEHPPLMKWVAAAPLWFGHDPAPADGVCGKEPTTKDHGYALAVGYLFGQVRNGDALLYRGRMAESLFALVLGVACFLFARELFGPGAGLIALLLLVFEPTILAHGALITTDAAVTAFILASVFALFRYYRKPTRVRLLIAGILTGLTFASKHSGVLIVPILIALSIVEFKRYRHDAFDPATGETAGGSLPRQLMRWTGRLALILLIGVGVLWCVYGLRWAARPGGEPMTTSLSQFIYNVQEQGTHGVVLTKVIPRLAKWHMLPQAYLYGLVDVLNVSDPGQPPFLLGTLYPHGRWFYFPVVFVIKSTLGFLALLLMSLLFGEWIGPDRFWKALYLVLPVAVVVLVAMQSGLNIGYRHVLPIVPFLCILIAGGVVAIWHRNRAWKAAVVLLLVFHIASSLRAYPNYLPYSNEAFGGPMKTYKVLTDSNVDWGQGLYQLRDYVQANGIRDCWLAYDGAADPAYYGIPCRKLPANIGDAGAVPPPEAEGLFFISDLTLSGIEWEPGDLNPYREFARATPVANIGGAILVYRGKFDLRDIEAVMHIARAYAVLGDRPAEAASEARAAVAIMPASVRAHLVLGQALAASGRRDEARQEIEAAQRLMRETGPQWYPLQIAAAHKTLNQLESASSQ